MPLTNTTTTTTFPPPNPHIHHTCKEPCKYGCCSSSNTTSSGNIEKAPSADANTFGKTTPPPTNKTLKQKTKPSYSKSVRSRHRNFKIREPDETGLRKEWREREREGTSFTAMTALARTANQESAHEPSRMHARRSTEIQAGSKLGFGS
jgi:hypothetical protein